MLFSQPSVRFHTHRGFLWQTEASVQAANHWKRLYEQLKVEADAKEEIQRALARNRTTSPPQAPASSSSAAFKAVEQANAIRTAVSADSKEQTKAHEEARTNSSSHDKVKKEKEKKKKRKEQHRRKHRHHRSSSDKGKRSGRGKADGAYPPTRAEWEHMRTALLYVADERDELQQKLHRIQVEDAMRVKQVRSCAREWCCSRVLLT